MKHTVFISAVSREFERARDGVANALQARGIDVKVQRSFSQSDSTTLAAMRDTIRTCHRVLAVVGSYSGMFPPETAVTDEYRSMLPPGMARASITQWEIIFARHHGVQTFYYEAVGHPPEREAAADDDAAAQAAWRHWLFDGGLGLFRRQFDSAGDLRADVMELDWRPNIRLKPIKTRDTIGRLFKGRDDFLQTLRAGFRQHRAQAVFGLGGVGKSRVAIEYGHGFVADYAALFLLTGKSENDLRDSLADLCGGAVLDLPEKSVPDLDARVAAVMRWLQANPGWLLIIDNVDDEPAAAAVRKFLDTMSRAGGHVLITGRVSEWSHGVEAVELELLSPEAARDLLRESTPNRSHADGEEAALARLADAQLGCLSLALVQAAAYIDAQRRSFADYSALFETEAGKLLARLGASAVRNLGYPHAVALTWQASFDQLGEEGRLLLDMLAWLSVEPIPRTLFDSWPERDEIDLEEGLEQLTRYSLVHWEQGNRAVTIHRLVAQVTRDNLDDAARDQALGALFPWLFAVNPEMHAGDVRCWPQLLPLLPHALALFARSTDLGPYPRQTDLYNEYATLLQSLAKFSEAEPLFRRALEIDDVRLGSDHSKIATRLNNLAGLLRATNRLAEAEPLFRRALAIDEASFGPDHPKVAIRLNNLAGVLRATNRLAEAESLFCRALAIDEASLGPDHPKVATRLNNLAGVLRVTNRLAEAESLIRRALVIDEVSFGFDHPRVATRLNNLAELLRATDRRSEAEPLFRRALAIDEASFGPDHPQVAIRLNNLAGLLRDTDRVDQAEPLVRRALTTDEASLGQDHPEVANGLNNLAALLQATDRLMEAEPLLLRAASILLRSSKASGHLLPNAASSVRNYAYALMERNCSPGEARAAVASLMQEAGFDPAELWPRVFGDAE